MNEDHLCSICGATPAPFGYGFPGHRRLLPVAKRGRLWACNACQPQAEARWRGATQNAASDPGRKSEASARPAPKQEGFDLGGRAAGGDAGMSAEGPVIVTLPWPNRILSPNARAHWRAIHTKKKVAKSLAFYLTKEQGATFEGAESLNVHVTFCPPNKRAFDMDNLLASLKASFDGIAEAVKVDDSRFLLSQSWGNVCKGGAVIVTVTP